MLLVQHVQMDIKVASDTDFQTVANGDRKWNSNTCFNYKCYCHCPKLKVWITDRYTCTNNDAKCISTDFYFPFE